MQISDQIVVDFHEKFLYAYKTIYVNFLTGVKRILLIVFIPLHEFRISLQLALVTHFLVEDHLLMGAHDKHEVGGTVRHALLVKENEHSVVDLLKVPPIKMLDITVKVQADSVSGERLEKFGVIFVGRVYSNFLTYFDAVIVKQGRHPHVVAVEVKGIEN